MAINSPDLTLLNTENNLAGKVQEMDAGYEYPKAAIECWEKHGNFYYHMEYECLILDT